MATIRDYKDLRVYQEAEWLDEQIWPLRDMIFEVDRSTWWQVSRSVGSVADNIAEGFNRGSRGEYKTFLGYSRGSAGEVRSQLRRMKRRGYLDAAKADQLIDRCARMERGLKNLIESIRDSPNAGMRHTQLGMVQEPGLRYGEREDPPGDDLGF